MRIFVKFTTLCLVTSATALFSANSANAADQNTYRPGKPYLKTVASHFNQCEQQCRGDAACRSWNFVRPNAGSASGICEFNSRMVTPVSSQVSMSGVVSSSADPLLSHAIASTRKSNTLRLGTPTPRQAPQSVNQNRTRPTQQRTRRVRQPVPQQRVPQLTNHTQAMAPKAPVQQRPQLTPQQAYYRQQYLAKKQYQTNMQKQKFMWEQNAQRPQKATQVVPPAPVRAPVQARRPITQPQHTMSYPIMSQHKTPQNLYGSLHDDLTKNMPEVPRPQTVPDNVNNPDAPISTSRAVPVTPVQTAPINSPALAGLAGG